MNSSLPTELLELKNQLDEWRQAHRTRARIPQHFYTTAVSLLDRCSLSLICQQTRLRPASLRKHVAADPSAAPPEESPQPAFFHLPTTALAPQTCAASSAARAPGTSAQESHARLLLDRSDGARLTLTLPTADWDRIHAMCLAFLGDR